MFANRSTHYYPENNLHSRGGRPHALSGTRCSGARFDDMFGDGSPQLARNRGVRRMRCGQERCARLDGTPMLQRGRELMGELTDGIRGLNLNGGLGTLGSRSSSMFGARPLLDDDFLGGLNRRRGGILLGRGMGMEIGLGGLNSRDSLLGGKAGLLGGGLLGGGLRASSRPGSILELQALHRPRMPYGSVGPRLSNYRSPCIEDYLSEIDPEELLVLEEMDRRGLGFWCEDPYEENFW
jgi:hypothetical protein